MITNMGSYFNVKTGHGNSSQQLISQWVGADMLDFGSIKPDHRRKFRSQTSDNMDRWKAEQGRGREKRKIRRKKSRRERVRRKKMQIREKVGKSRNTVFFQWFVAPEGRKVGAKAAGAELAGQTRDEKLHAVVARSTFQSENVQNTPFSDNFWQSIHIVQLAKHGVAFRFAGQNQRAHWPDGGWPNRGIVSEADEHPDRCRVCPTPGALAWSSHCPSKQQRWCRAACDRCSWLSGRYRRNGLVRLCFQFKESIAKAPSLGEKLASTLQYRQHLSDQYSDRCITWALQELALDDLFDLCVMTTDGMDQGKYALPRDPHLRASAAAGKLRQNRPRIKVHGRSLAFVLLNIKHKIVFKTNTSWWHLAVHHVCPQNRSLFLYI